MLQTPLISFHRSQNAKLVDFAGWEMPVLYTSILEEHHFTRRHATFFDVSHMGRVEFRGSGAEPYLERLCTRRLGDMKVGQSRYSHVCRDDGGILDDVIVSRCDGYLFMVCNASNRLKLLSWFEQQHPGYDVTVIDKTLETAMLAIQGPEAIETLEKMLPFKLSDLKRYYFRTGELMGQPYYAARSGYTGEDGVEVIIPAHLAATAATMLVSESAELGRPIKPAGLGARDTLRTEAAMPLYGHELTEDWDSMTAGQGWCVDLTKDFIGRDALARVKERGAARPLAGFELEGKRVARQGAKILQDGREVGVITSGSLSPTFEKVIGMGFLDQPLCEPGTIVEMDLRTSTVPAKVVPIPFYKRGK